MNPLHICTTTKEAAVAIQTHSFAIVRISQDIAGSVARASAEARLFLDPSRSQAEELLKQYRRIADGNLMGFNVPSNAKVLFRAICSDWGTEMGQPWPTEALRRTSIEVASKLHALLVDCYDDLTRLCNDPPPAKRPTLPRTREEARYCPLDYFLYRAADHAVNCSEHKDRGVLICVALTNVPGLEVLPRHSPDFVCPELLVASDVGHGVEPDLVCIMAGDQLKLFLGQQDGNVMDACIHRVRTRLESSRLSITYEVRAH